MEGDKASDRSDQTNELGRMPEPCQASNKK